MVATLWLLSLLTVTLITVSECVYAPPPLVKYRRFDNTAFGFQVIFIHVNLNILSSKCLTEVKAIYCFTFVAKVKYFLINNS